MYSPSDVFNAIKDPIAATREVNRLCHTRGGRYRFNPAGTGIFELDWDVLIILDACRYDIFNELADLPGQTNYRYSLGSATYEFIPANFSDKKLHDTVYVSSNIWYLKLKDRINSEIFKFVNLLEDGHEVEWANKALDVPTPKNRNKPRDQFRI